MAEQNSNDKPGELGADAPTVAVPTLDETTTAPAVSGTAPDDDAAVAADGVSEPELWAGPEFDEEFPEEGEDEGVKTGLVATFLPGVDATAIIALALSLLGAAAYLLIYPLAHAKSMSDTWSAALKNQAQDKDPFTADRMFINYQSWGHIALGVAAILVALLVLGLWTAGRNKLWSRSVAQAALVVGLGVLIYGVLLKTGVVGAVPSHNAVIDYIAKNAAATGGTG